jgi:hypothetical protein
MRRPCFAAMILCFCATSALGQETGGDKAARAVIDKAVKAVGGADKLGRLKTATMKIKGPMQVGIQVMQFTGTASFAELDSFRIKGELDGNELHGVMSFADAWLKRSDKVEAIHPEAFAGMQCLLHATRTATMLLPLQDKAYTLTLGNEAKVDERRAILVKAKHKDHPAIDYYFDKETGLPLKVATRVKILFNEIVTYECTFADFRDKDGLKLCTSMTIVMELLGEKMSFDATLSNVEIAVKLKDGHFARPE